MSGFVWDIKTVNFHCNISHDHLLRYMKRWQGESDRGRKFGGTIPECMILHSGIINI